MGDAIQEIESALIQPERELHPDRLKKDRRRLEDVFALLDLIGWSAGGVSEAAEIDPRKYGRVLKEAIDDYLPLLADREGDADADEARRAEQGKPPGKDEIISSASALREFATLIQQAIMDSAR